MFCKLIDVNDDSSSPLAIVQLTTSTNPESEPRPIYALLSPDSNSIFCQESCRESPYFEYTLSSFIEPSKIADNCGAVLSKYILSIIVSAWLLAESNASMLNKILPLSFESVNE